MRRLVYPLLFIIITAFGFFWHLKPTYAEIQDLRDQVQEYDQTLSQINQLQSILNDKLAQRDAITNDELDRLNRILPETVDTVRFLIELDQIAARHGMSAQNVTFSGAPKAFGGSSSGGTQGGNGYNSLTTSFSVSGTYADVQNFMRDLETSSRLMDVTEFSLSTPNESEEGDSEEASFSSGQNSYDFTVRTYWRK